MSWSRLATYAAIAVVAIVAANVFSILQREGAPKRAYVLLEATVTNETRYAAYEGAAPDVVTRYGGRYLTRGGRMATLEGPSARGRIAIIEFPSYEAAERFYGSAELAEARKLREGAANVRAVILEAL